MIAIIDESAPHHHNHTIEKYTVLRGKIDLFVDNIKHELGEGDTRIIESGQIHWAKGNETWVEVIATPPWNAEDHIMEQDED